MTAATLLPLSITDAALIDGYLGDTIKTLSARPGLTEAGRPAQEEISRKMILALGPKDAKQLILAGQAVLFNALTASAAIDLQAVTDEKLKPRALSRVISLGRLAARAMDRLIRLQTPRARGALKPIPQETRAEPESAPLDLSPPPRPPAEEAPIAMSRAMRRLMAKRSRDRSGTHYVPPRTSSRKHKIAAERAARLVRAAMAGPAGDHSATTPTAGFAAHAPAA